MRGKTVAGDTIPFPRKLHISWADIKECGDGGYTMKDTAAVLEVDYTHFKNIVRRNPPIKDCFKLNYGQAAWVARKGYVPGSQATPSIYKVTITCRACGGECIRKSWNQIYCKECQPMKRREYSRVRNKMMYWKKKKANLLFHPFAKRNPIYTTPHNVLNYIHGGILAAIGNPPFKEDK